LIGVDEFHLLGWEDGFGQIVEGMEGAGKVHQFYILQTLTMVEIRRGQRFGCDRYVEMIPSTCDRVVKHCLVDGELVLAELQDNSDRSLGPEP
jgi:hypothetical protein